MANKQSSSGLIGGIVVGTAVGIAIGAIVTPRRGKETRAILKKTAAALPEIVEDLSTTVKIQTDKLSDLALDGWYDTLDRLSEAVAAGVAASRQVRRDNFDSEPDDRSSSIER
jgi:gas vesicle protein